MLKSTYLTEDDLKDFGFKSLGKNVRISSDARIYGQQNISIGNDVRIDDFVILSATTGYIILHDHVYIARNVHLSATKGIEMNEYVGIGANTTVFSASDDFSGPHMTSHGVPAELTTQVGGPVVFGRFVSVGSNCTIIGPCDLGEGCSVGAMSLVKKVVQPWWVYVGIPAKPLKERSRELLELVKKIPKD
jgi:galactoside O-acetyltransferase